MKKAKDSMEKRKGYKLIFIGIGVCTILVVIILSVLAVTGRNDDTVKSREANEETEKSQVSSENKEKTSKTNKNSMERYLEVSDPEKRTKDYMTEAARYSREMSEKEQSRYQDFLDRYEKDELAPKEEIEIVDKMEDYDKEVDHPVYAIWEVEFFLPERTLTDEELLQMVDFQYKLNYALQQRNDEVKKAAENSTDKITKEGAVKKASEAIEKMFGVDTSSLEKDVLFNGVSTYIVEMKEKGEKRYLYTVHIEVGNGAVSWIISDPLVPEIENALDVDKDFEKMYKSNYKNAKMLLNNILDSGVQIVSGCCQFQTDKTGNKMPEGTVGYITYYFKMEDETVYEINYNILKDKCERLSRIEKEYSSYKTKEELEKEGAERKGDKFIVPLTGEEKEAYGREDMQWMVVPME